MHASRSIGPAAAHRLVKFSNQKTRKILEAAQTECKRVWKRQTSGGTVGPGTRPQLRCSFPYLSSFSFYFHIIKLRVLFVLSADAVCSSCCRVRISSPRHRPRTGGCASSDSVARPVLSSPPRPFHRTLLVSCAATTAFDACQPVAD